MGFKNTWIIGARLEKITEIQEAGYVSAILKLVRDFYYFFVFIVHMGRLVAKLILLVFSFFCPCLRFEMDFYSLSKL